MHHLEERVGPAKSLVFCLLPMQIPFFLPSASFRACAAQGGFGVQTH